MAKSTKLLLTVILFLALSIVVNAQMILLLEKPGTVKNIKYRAGDQIYIKTKDELKFSGTINIITDSSIIVNYDVEILIKDITIVFQEMWFISLFSRVAYISGAGYLILDAFNRTINNEYPIIDKSSFVIGTSLIGGGLLMKANSYKRCKINKPWRFKVLDFSN